MSVLESLAAEEQKLLFPEFSPETAYELGVFITGRIRERHLPLAVNIDRQGHCLYHYSPPGTTRNNDRWLKGKTRVVYYFQHSSYYVSRMLKEKGTGLASHYFLNPDLYRASGGAFPLNVKGAGLVAVASVSGLPDREDHEFLTETLGDFLRGRD